MPRIIVDRRRYFSYYEYTFPTNSMELINNNFR